MSAITGKHPGVDRHRPVAHLLPPANGMTIAEVLVANKVCITARSYPSLPQSRNIELLALGGQARLSHLEIRDLESIW